MLIKKKKNSKNSHMIRKKKCWMIFLYEIYMKIYDTIFKQLRVVHTIYISHNRFLWFSNIYKKKIYISEDNISNKYIYIYIYIYVCIYICMQNKLKTN